MGSEEENSALYQEARPIQKAAGTVTVVSSILALILMVQWMKADSDDTGFNGYNWSSKLFPYHPTFMCASLILGSFSAIVTYRIVPLPKMFTKSIHVALHTGSLLCLILGLYAIFAKHDESSKNGGNYSANLYTIHSFIGLGAVIIYFLNYMFGAIHFLPPLEVIPLEFRKAYMPNHVFFGTFAVIASAMAAESGIMELAARNGCGYSVDSADINPAEHYHRLTYGCKLANGVGILIYLALFSLLFAIYKFEKFHTGEKTKEPLLV
jgi:cytochrome b-561